MLLDKLKITFTSIILLLCITIACHSLNNDNKSENMKTNNLREIYFAGGCFWGTEHFMKQIKGVKTTEVGYANGNTSNPSYEQVCNGNTGFAETVKVIYNPQIVDLELLINLYLNTIDPTSINRQGNDQGSQYRTGIYYTDSSDVHTINNTIRSIAGKYNKPIVVEIKPLQNFYEAEEFHQNYLDKNKGGYCHIRPELFELARRANEKTKFKKPDDSTLRSILSKEQYIVTQKNGTEPAFKNEYWDEKREGIYVDITTGEPLFVSTDKFDSGCGWPSFTKPIKKELIKEKTDTSYGMKRIEVRSSTGDAHLGHVFNDGPIDKGGLRYCMNSASLRFIPKEEMKAEGYEDYIYLLK